MDNNLKILFNVKEIAKYMNCSVSFIRKLKDENKIPYIKIEGKIMFLKESIDEWLKSKQGGDES